MSENKKVVLVIVVLYITISICITQYIGYKKDRLRNSYQQMNKTISKTSPKH